MTQTSSTFDVTMFGFGKIGQAVGAALLQAGLRLNVVDTDPVLIASLHNRVFNSTEPGVEPVILQGLQEGRLTVGNDLDLPVADSATALRVILLTIPLGVDAGKFPETGGFTHLLTHLLPLLHHQALILVETSVPVGFCRRTIHGLLEASGKIHGSDYLLAHGPERIKSGSMLAQLNSVPKVVGGFDEEATAAAVDFYRSFLPSHLVTAVRSLEEAEFTKMAGMLYRDINIALVNQLALFASATGMDLDALIPLINSDREAGLLQPGIGVGGHCTPVYPWFLIRNFEEAGLEFTLATEARRINEAMPVSVLEPLLADLKGKQAVLLGLSFRPGVKEDSHSPAYAIRDYLLDSGFRVGLHDPLYSNKEIAARGFEPVMDPYEAKTELLIMVTMHPSYAQLDWKQLHRDGLRLIVDGRNKLPARMINDAGVRYVGIGRE